MCEVCVCVCVCVVCVSVCQLTVASGHTVMLTLLNFFIVEYSPRNWRGIEMLTASMTTAGMFFILAAHEHYTIDVFIAFLIASRLYLYYHRYADSLVSGIVLCIVYARV